MAHDQQVNCSHEKPERKEDAAPRVPSGERVRLRAAPLGDVHSGAFHKGHLDEEGARVKLALGERAALELGQLSVHDGAHRHEEAKEHAEDDGGALAKLVIGQGEGREHERGDEQILREDVPVVVGVLAPHMHASAHCRPAVAALIVRRQPTRRIPGALDVKVRRVHCVAHVPRRQIVRRAQVLVVFRPSQRGDPVSKGAGANAHVDVKVVRVVREARQRVVVHELWLGELRDVHACPPHEDSVHAIPGRAECMDLGTFGLKRYGVENANFWNIFLEAVERGRVAPLHDPALGHPTAAEQVA
mmetsp:Transcript_19745/g.66376  ORF Transcript_19745/g.66376 Transcript_19745/m.66376 type:complete len:302 (+) Transcript_19745:197-1102(+)